MATKDLLPEGWDVIVRDYDCAVGIVSPTGQRYMFEPYKSPFVPFIYTKAQVENILGDL